jgi:hypothetical protein
VLESVFLFFFKYERLVFEQGQFVLGATRSMWLVAGVAIAVAVYVAWTYGQLKVLTNRDRVILLTTRLAILAVALFATLRPLLILKVAVPQQNIVGVLIDDSRSMQVVDQGGQARSEFVKAQLGHPGAPLLSGLSERFVPRIFKFSNVAERLQSSGDLTFQGTGTRVGDALTRASDMLSGLSLSGLVVVTDGADNAEITLDQTIEALKAKGIPVFTVGVGKEQLARDIQINRVEAPRRVLKSSSLVVDVVVSQVGYAGQAVDLVVEEDGRIVSQQSVKLPADGEAQTFKVRFKAGDPGARTFRFKVAAAANEEVIQNNQRDALIDVLGDRQKVLMVDGQPRPEPKFIRQATQTDENVQIVWLQRMAEATPNAPEKYWRAGVDSPLELQAGFPATRKELYGYRGIIIGSIEAAAFTPEQQRMLEDFVEVRGGSLIALGGERALGEGSWGGTPLASALPISIEPGKKAPTYPPFVLTVRPTPAGQSHPSTQIADTDAAIAAKWKELPPLTAVNSVFPNSLKPGATMLLSGADERGREHVVLAYQRFGRGKTLVMGVQDTWLWQMHASVAVDDQTHENLWQRMSRWLVEGVPDRVMVTAAPDKVERGQPVTITAEALDEDYHGVNDGRVLAHVTSPSGVVKDVPLEWTVEQDGEYHGRFTPTEDGVHKIAVDGRTAAGLDLPRGTTNFRVGPSDAEYFDVAMRASLLQRVAEETGGRFFPASDTSRLPEAISYSGRGVTVVEERELWDMPIILFLLLGLMGSEWMFRRSRGVA